MGRLDIVWSGTKLLDQSQNGHKLVTNDWQDWCLTFITRNTAVNIVMWVTQLSTVDWVCSKTQTLLAALRIQSEPRREFFRFGSRTFVPISWMCKKKTNVQYPTALQKLKLSRWMLDCEWMDYLLSIYDVVIEVLCSTSNAHQTSWNRCETGDQPQNTSTLKQKKIRDGQRLLKVDNVPTNAHFLKVGLICTYLKTVKR